MVMEVGQDDWTGAGDMRAEHQCWTCGYREADKAWSRPLKTDGHSAAQAAKRLMDLRLHGIEMEIVYDDTPFPEFSLDDEEPEPVDDGDYCVVRDDRHHCEHWYDGAMCCDCYTPGVEVLVVPLVVAELEASGAHQD